MRIVFDWAGVLFHWQPRQPVAAGAVKVAVRPEAWSIVPTDGAGGASGAPGASANHLPGRIAKTAYLGSTMELTIDTELGAIFVVSPEMARDWCAGTAVSLALGLRGVSVVAA